MDIEIRPATDADIPAIVDLDGASFGVSYSAEQVADFLTLIDTDRFLVAIDDGRVVGVTGDYPFTMTVPGGSLDVPGVTWVSVEPTHRRRGILRSLMQRQLEGYRDRGIAAAVLTASEGGIYGRFGYGPASFVRKTVIDRRRVRLRRPSDTSAVRRVSAAEARARMPEIHERWRARTPGALNRTAAWWDFLVLDREWQRDGMSAQYYLVHDDGYVAYRVKDQWDDGDPQHLCWITDYVIASPKAHGDLWQVLLGLDLVGTIESHRIPIDDPLPYVVDDGRQVRTTHVGDGVWVRPLDIAAMLAARSYAVGIDVVLQVSDPLFGDGRYALCAGPNGAACTPTDRSPDVGLDVAALGSLVLGGVRLAPLVAAGQVHGENAALLSRLDRALLADRAPQHGTAF